MATQDKRDGDPSSWSSLHLWQIQPLRDVAVVLGLLGLIYLGSVISVVTVPLLLALLLAYLVEPLVGLIERKTFLKRRGAVVIMLFTVAGIVIVPVGGGLTYGVAEAIEFSKDLREDVSALRQSLADPENERLERRVPEGVWTGVRDAVLWARERAAESDADAGAAAEGADGQADGEASVEGSEADTEDSAPADAEPSLAEADDGEPTTTDAVLAWIEGNAAAIARNLFRTGGDAIGALVGLVGAAASLGLMLFLTVFFFFFISSGWSRVLRFLGELVPESNRDRAFELAGKLDRVVSGFVRGRLLIALILGAWFSVGWWAVGVPLAPIVGMATGILAAFPYAALAGLPVAIVLIALENHTGFRGEWWWWILGPGLIYQFGQMADDYLLTPAIQGKETDLDVPSIMFAVFAGGALFGVYGLLIAIPLAACLKVVIRELWWPRYRAWVQGERADVLPLDRE
ncbi:MAG: AI-2E family transporter [Planctomycetota bacterium]